MKQELPIELYYKIVLYLSHPTSNLIKKEIKEIDNIIKPLQKIFNLDFTNKTFYYRWRNLRVFRGIYNQLYYKKPFKQFIYNL